VTAARIGGRPVEVSPAGEVVVESLPAEIVFLHRSRRQ
jgi:hypothetical protein